jgi:MscS family membrane protein
MAHRNDPPASALRLPLALLALLLLPALAARAEPRGPLAPIDTSSPRTTLAGFLDFTSEAYAMGVGLTQAYLDSSELFLSPNRIAAIAQAQDRVKSAVRALDLSQVPPAMVEETSRRSALLLEEVLTRVDIPPAAAIPDAAAMAAAEFKRWTLPGTEIRIARVESGARSGEYLFTPETVERLPEFYAKVKDLPYQPGMTGGMYDFIYRQPSGLALALRWIVPPRWMLDLPPWTRAMVLGQPLWRWVGIAAVLGMGLGFVRLCFRLARRWSAGQPESSRRWADLLRPLSLAAAAPAAALILSQALRISGGVNEAFTLSLWSLFYLALTWSVWDAGGALAETLIGAERLRAGSIDSQLIRLALRLLTVILAVAILVMGADRIGLPAYSVVAGLGVGGLAVALAAQQTLANLLGSLIIMFEKPFAIGHYIKAQGVEGTVEGVGFRSTRIRTFYDSLVSIPSSQLVNGVIDNLESRRHRQVKTFLSLTYDTPAAQVAEFASQVERLLQGHPDIRKDNIQVAFHDLGPHSLDILLNFFLRAPDRAAELAERQRIFLDILALAEAMGVRFAFPTQTLHLESLPEGHGTARPGDPS